MKPRVFLQMCVVAAACFSPSRVCAENQRVLLIHAGASDPITTHLVDELLAAGFVVEIIPFGEYDMTALAREHHARAVVRVSSSRRGVDLWTASPQEILHVEEKPEEKGDLATLSLRAVEELRGKLMEHPPPVEPIPAEPLPPPDEKKGFTLPNPSGPSKPAPIHPTEPQPRRYPEKPASRSGSFWLHVAPGMMVHPGSGGVGMGAAAMIGARYMFLRRFGADFIASFPIVPSTIASPFGNVNVAASSILLGGWVEVAHPLPSLTFGLGAGAGLGIFHHYGQPQAAGIEARDGNVAYALPYARSTLAWSFSSNISIRADLLAAIATPRPVLRLPGLTSDVYFGQPLILIGLGLDLKLK